MRRPTRAPCRHCSERWEDLTVAGKRGWGERREQHAQSKTGKAGWQGRRLPFLALLFGTGIPTSLQNSWENNAVLAGFPSSSNSTSTLKK